MDGISVKDKNRIYEIFKDGNPFFVDNVWDFNISVPTSFREVWFTGLYISIPGSLLTLCEVQVFLGK